eukprot:CAMPEP_0182618612 /NCGR_PEP_ID=MMETSP1330-20130603/45683_1 /TAXON_ID=464278 /ORGANISM="Picochlorum sp., Strain RCC944" /LENGTH=64 /DNA_ID=CAMNT_0024838835 /DNA_START=149 /DNA_END=343 /DNA_ORIENTATION=-
MPKGFSPPQDPRRRYGRRRGGGGHDEICRESTDAPAPAPSLTALGVGSSTASIRYTTPLGRYSA